MKADPCEQHSTWTDFPGPMYACPRCGWSEKAIEVRHLEQMLDDPRTFLAVQRDEPALASLWKREMTNCPDFQVQPVTVEEMEEFLRSTSATPIAGPAVVEARTATGTQPVVIPEGWTFTPLGTTSAKEKK